ncbi:Bug family tripartite tricarboxylate transporter substrate binding protein [Cupriavidus basilensis]|uniref:Bug family tripartite tricarboxylate transporter substrate binding protein n=1 Tax=Cupriavidus basilensis TaxID=68895 RepID=UPI00157B56A1|nr:tripartite tricarboxylate transporter substrate binding protein [Cupriavidus basilensis]NUA32084.1 tripartite tricarboxylate transporter substrate binding protein [Cupriavidus basilensis]
METTLNALASLRSALVLSCALAAAPLANAQPSYPDKPIRIVVPFPPGGPTDSMARLVAQYLGQQLSQSVIVDNRGGAGGNIATEVAASSPADGYTLYFGTTGTMAINPSLYRHLKTDPIKALDSVGSVASTPNLLVVSPTLPANNIKELIALARQKPGSLTFGSAGNGSSNHLSGELFRSMAGIDITHVPYKGTGAALTDLFGGRISMLFDTVANQVQFIASGKVKPIALTGAHRSEALPKVPTIAESGLPDFDVTIWFGISAPKGTPPEVVKLLNLRLQTVLAMPEVKSKLSALGAQPMPGTPADYTRLIQADTAKWAKVVKLTGATLD